MDKGKSRKLLDMVIGAYEVRPFFQSTAQGIPQIGAMANPKLPAAFVKLEDGRMIELTAHEKTKFLSFTITAIYEAHADVDLVGCDVKDELEETLTDLEQTTAFQDEAVNMTVHNFRVGPTIPYGGTSLIRVEPPLFGLAIDCEIEFDYDTTT